MTSVRFYFVPTTGSERLFGDAPCTSSCAFSTEAKLSSSRCGEFYRPRLDIRKSDDSDIVTATFELPGLTSDDVTIDVQRNQLTVSGEFSSSDSQEEKNYVVRERRSGKFSRTLQLPVGTRAEDVKAKMENGVLSITFPKSTPEQEAKRIVIQ